MMFIGSGTLLFKAVNYALTKGFHVDAVCCAPGDSALPRLKKLNISILESQDPNSDLTLLIDRFSPSEIFSINNKFLIDDRLLNVGPNFYNIHNGLIQAYRGIAEVCIFAAICRGETQYGVTLHSIQAKQEVDAGPIMAQLSFELDANADFATLMRRSLDLCHQIFEENLNSLVTRNIVACQPKMLGVAYYYKDILGLCAQATTKALNRACNLGPYTNYFPRLARAIEVAKQKLPHA